MGAVLIMAFGILFIFVVVPFMYLYDEQPKCTKCGNYDPKFTWLLKLDTWRGMYKTEEERKAEHRCSSCI